MISLPAAFSKNVAPNCCFPLSKPVVYLLDTDVDLLFDIISEAPTLPVSSPIIFIFSVVAYVESTIFDCASAAFFADLSSIHKPPTRAATAAAAATYGLVSIGAIPATADAPITAIPAFC